MTYTGDARGSSGNSASAPRHVRADEQPRHPRGRAFGRELLVDAQAAALEQPVQQVHFRVAHRLRESALEVRRVVRDRRRLVAHQHAVLAQHREQFARGRREKFLHHAFVQRNPFRVRARHADELLALFERRVEVPRAEQLRLLAAHDVGRAERVAAAHAGDDEHAVANARGILRELVELRGAR